MPLSEAEFGALCKKLSDNDRMTTSLYGILPNGYGFRLGQALQNNTRVSNLTLDLSSWRVDGDNDPTVTDNISMILHFLRSGPSLEWVSFRDGTLDYTNACIRALSQNPNLQTFSLQEEEVEFSPSVLAEWLQSTQTLQTLYLSPTVTDNDLVAAALGANSSISHLTVSLMNSSSNPAFLDHIGRRTATPLDELRLHGNVLSGSTLVALTNLALSSSTIISSLSLASAVFDMGFLGFLHALSSRRGPCMIAKLKLSYSRFTEATAIEILASVETEISSSRNTANAAANDNATLKEIVFVGNDGHNGALADAKLFIALALIARYSLERLECQGFNRVGHANDLALFWTKMNEHICASTGRGQAPFRRLGEIAVHPVLTGNDNAMFDCLPKLVSLRTLTTIPYWRHYGNGHRRSAAEAILLAKAIRRNGSLTRVTIEDQYQWSAMIKDRFQLRPATVATDLTMLTNRVDRIAVAALQRNEMLPKLLSRPTTQDENQQEDANRVEQESLAEQESRYPHLFAAALPAKFMTPHFVLMGLNTLDNYNEGKGGAR